MRYIGCLFRVRNGVKVRAGRLNFLQTQSFLVEKDKWFSSWETAVGLFFVVKSAVKNINKRKNWRGEKFVGRKSPECPKCITFYLKTLKLLYSIQVLLHECT